MLRICWFYSQGWVLVEKIVQRSLTRVWLRKQSLLAAREIIFLEINQFLLSFTKNSPMAFHNAKKYQTPSCGMEKFKQPFLVCPSEIILNILLLIILFQPADFLYFYWINQTFYYLRAFVLVAPFSCNLSKIHVFTRPAHLPSFRILKYHLREPSLNSLSKTAPQLKSLSL